MKKTTLFCFLILFTAITGLKAQLLTPSSFIAGSQQDIDYLANGYLSPFARSLGVGINNGWYYTAKPHKLGRFDIMATVSVISIPTEDETFTISNSDLNSLVLANSNISQAETPTAFGSEEDGPALKAEGDITNISQFNAPGGVGFSYMPVPMLNASVGLVKNTNVHLRYLPTMGIPGVDDGEINMFGIGVTHDILQWIPGADKIPLDVSLFFGYTGLSYEQALNDDDQKMDIDVNGYTFRALVSKKFLFVTVYGGAGFNSGTTNIRLLGTYSYDNGIQEVTYEDPVDLTVDDAGGFVGNLGVRLKFLWVMAVTADYTFGTYNAFTSGLGVSIDF